MVMCLIMKHLSLFKKNAVLMTVMLTLGFLFTSCSKLYDDNGWQYFAEEPLLGLYSAISYLLSLLGGSFFMLYFLGGRDTSFLAFYSFPFFFSLWVFIYGNILFLFRTELHWSIDGTIALISAWLTYRFYKSEFYNNSQLLVHIISLILAIIGLIYFFSISTDY